MNSQPDTALRAGRWITVCALMLGLFAMHGLASAAGTGCHGGPAVTMTDAAPAVHPMASPVDTVGVSEQQHGSAQALSPSSPQGSAGSCVSTPPRIASGLSGPSLPALALAVLLAVPVAGPQAGGLWWRASRRRGPPAAGIALLTQVCVSRT